MPSRSSMLTGLLPRTHGVSDNGIDLNPDFGKKALEEPSQIMVIKVALLGNFIFLAIRHLNQQALLNADLVYQN